jgi:hypothetical protein
VMSTDRRIQPPFDGGIGGSIVKLVGIYRSINQSIAVQVWWLHGPPFTENSTKIPYKSMLLGTERGEGANRTYTRARLN